MDEKTIAVAVQKGIERDRLARETGMTVEEYESDQAEKAMLKAAPSLFDGYGGTVEADQ